MKTAKLQGFFRKAWLCPCLICLLSSCAALQKPAQEQTRYRVTLTIIPGSNETEIAAVLAGLPVSGLSFVAPYTGLQTPGFQSPPTVIALSLPGEQAVQRLEQQLQTAGIPVSGYHIQKLD